MSPPCEITSRLRILAGPVLASLGTGTLWLLVARTHFPRISNQTRSATDLYGSFLDSWNSLLEHFENIRLLFKLARSDDFHFHLTSHLHEPQVYENIALAVLATACYSTAIALIRKHQDCISRTWSLRLVMGVLVALNLHLLGKMVSNRYAPLWLLLVNSLLQTLHWDWWSEVGKEVREKFWIARMRSLGFKFAGIIDGKSLDKSANVAKDSEKNPDGATDSLQKS